MPKRSSKKRPTDINELARAIVDEATGNMPEEKPTPETPQKNPAAVALGRLGGKKGGPARAAKLTPEERRDIAKRAAEKRWKTSEQGS
ncbi:MAG: hypothetical protein M1380_05710 [Chloroflexi bacterium]|nr:hypothetical protein [Chloroflexota bacterium]